MKIRVINENDWERTYEFDKSIIRVGSQLSCDIQLAGKDIQPMQMQIVRSGGKEIKYTLRIFADNVQISRGEQTFTGQQMVPYDVLDDDKLIFGSYRMSLSLEDEQTRVRASKNMEAKMYIQKRELGVDSPINGVLRLKNTGTEKACQFRMQIRGIPDECLTTAPLPYLYPGGKSTVGFMISHLQTKPAPGFHTVSILLNAPDDYFGEVLEFRQDIYVNPVFKNEIILEDDSDELSGFNKAQGADKKQPEGPEQQTPVVRIQETARMIPGQAVIEKEETEADDEKKPVVISGSDNKNAFTEENDGEAEGGNRRRRPNRKQKINVIRHDDEAFTDDFEDEEKSAEIVTSAEDGESFANAKDPVPAPAEAPEPVEKTEAPAEPEEAPVKPKKNSGRKKTAVPAADEEKDTPPEEPKKAAETPKPKSRPEPVKQAEPDPEPEPEILTEPESAAGPAAQTEPAAMPEPAGPTEPEETEENLPEEETVSEPAEMQGTGKEGPKAAQIPVLHHSDLFDFPGEDEPFASPAEEEPEVRFVKRGNFDD